MGPRPMNVPNVTIDDLKDFHQSHLGQEDADDGLGYYADGVKRTLTDEQIAIFRYSEIQRLLRERRARREADAEKDNSGVTKQQGHKKDISIRPASSHDDPFRARSKFDYKNEHISRQTRNRRARELDAAQSRDVELDY